MELARLKMFILTQYNFYVIAEYSGLFKNGLIPFQAMQMKLLWNNPIPLGLLY